MNKAPRSRWLRVARASAVVYCALWIATAVWGPDAVRRWDHRRHVEYYTNQGWDPSGDRRQIVSVSVPAPFLVWATWRSESRGPNGQLGSRSEGEVCGFWVFGWLGVYRDRMHWVACG